MAGQSPSSESSSCSRSPPSRSSSDSRSAPSQSSSRSYSRSSLSHKADGSCSPPSQSSSDGRSTPSGDGAQARAFSKRSTEKYSHLPNNSEELNLKEQSTDNKQVILKNVEDFYPLKHEQKRRKKPAADDSRKDKRRHNTGPTPCKYDAPLRDKAAASDTSGSVQPLLKPDKPLYKERKAKEERNFEREKGRRRGKYSDSRRDVERRHKVKPSKESDRVASDRRGSPGGSKAPHSRSEKNRKRKAEDQERKTSLYVKPETRKSESPKTFDKKKQKTEKKMERKSWPLTETDIWEEGMKVKPPKKISININLVGKRKEEKIDKQDLSYLESVAGKSQENTEHTGIRGEEKLNNDKTENEANEKRESSREQDIFLEEKLKADTAGEEEKTAVEEEDEGEEEDEDFYLWHCALRGVEGESERASDDRRERGVAELALTSQRARAGRDGARKGDRGEPRREELMEERRVREEEETMRCGSQRSKKESQDDGRNTTPDDGSHTSMVGSCGGEDTRERRTMLKTVEEYAQDRVADRREELVLIQVPRSKWEKEDEEAQGEGEVRVLPHPSVTLSSRETEGDNEQRQRSMEMERDGERVMGRGRDREENRSSSLSCSHRSAAPSGGKGKTYSTLCTHRDRETRTERGREKERQKESKRSKEQTREEEKGRNRERERDCSSSIASAQKRNLPSCSVSTSQERRDRQRGGSYKSSSCPDGKSSSVRSRGSSNLPDQNAHKTYRDKSVELKCKDKEHPLYHNNHPDPSGNYRHQDRPAGTLQSPPSLSHSHGKERDPLPFESPGGPRRESPDWGLMQYKGRNESKGEQREWEPSKADKAIKEGKREGETEEVVPEQGGGSRQEADKPDGETGLGRRRELEEGESSSSSASPENRDDDTRNERRKKHKIEMRQVAPEPKSKNSKEGTEEESGGEVDDYTKLFSVMLS